MPSPNKVALKIHVDPWIKESLDAYSKKLDVSLNFLCVQALKEYLEGLPPVESAQITIVVVSEGEEDDK